MLKKIKKLLEKNEPVRTKQAYTPSYAPTYTPPPTIKYVDIIMDGGKVEKYPENSSVSGSDYCVVVAPEFHCFHTFFDCDNMKWEIENTGNPILGYTIKEAKEMHLNYCPNCLKRWHEEDSEFEY